LAGFVGRFVGVKNLVSLLETFSDICRQLPHLYLLLVGTGPQERDLKDLARSKGIQNKVIFAGIRKDVGKILTALDIFVLPSFTEGLSTSLLEAMAAGKAIICSDIPGNTLLVRNGVNGFIFSPASREELKNAFSQLAQDPELRTRIGKAALQTAINYDEDKILPLVERYYENVLENFKKR
jgi:glycosyltransferase involved in cell wall biosynthesis